MEYPEHSDPDGEEEKARAPKRGVSTSDSVMQQKRSHSPVPSCVSMKSDRSRDLSPFLAEGGVPAGQRSPSPVSSCVSMKSDQSMDLPLPLAEGGVPAGQSYQPGPVNVEMQQIHKSHLQKKFQCLTEGITKQGNPTPLSKIYTELYITEGGRGRVNKEHEVRQIERASWREAAPDTSINCSDIFTNVSGQDRPIRTVLTKGVAGIGKTVSVQKFILDWAEEKANQDVQFIFPLPFRELNLMKEKKLSLVELIQHFCPEIKDTRIFTGSEQRDMFIFDGLDECRFLLDFNSNPRCCDVTEPASVDALLTNLIEGNLLPSALLWITTRPAAANHIPPACVERVTEIRGFNDPQKGEYFKKRISDEILASRTITHLKSSRSLFIMCHIPVFCWIVATVLERLLRETGRREIPRTLTQMYTHFLIVQTSTKKEKYTVRKERDEEMIFKLGKLAFQQLEKGNLIFYEEDLRECGIDVTEASVYSGVCTQIFREESGLYQGKVFSFVHLSIQEFLAALYVFLCFSNRERNMTDQQQTCQFSALFRAAKRHDLHKTAVDLALQSENGHLDLFLRFLLGLSLESNQNILRHLLPQTRSPSQSSEQTVQYVKQKIRDQDTSARRINLFYCLNELNHHAVVESINWSSGTLSIEMLLPGEWRTRTLMFKISEEQLDEFDLQKYIKTPEEDMTELLSPDDVLQKLVPGVTSALLSYCSLTEKSCAAIASAARSSSCSLKELKLSHNYLRDAGVQHLSDLLKNPHCKLETLELEDCSLKTNSCAAIASAARSTSCSLKVLNLSVNGLYDAGVQHLTDLLKYPHCKLETLKLRRCFITENSCADLASAVRSTSCSLKELDLRDNELHDAGVQHLWRETEQGEEEGEEERGRRRKRGKRSRRSRRKRRIKRGRRKRRRAVEEKGEQIGGVQHLSDLLKNPHCNLEKLVMDGGIFIKESPSASSASSSHSSDDAELHLKDKTQQDPGAQLLSDDTPKEDQHTNDPQRSCESCVEVPDTSHWVLVEPEVSTEKSVSIYSLSSPAGSYECSESGLRWSCAGPVTLQYRFTDWHVYAEELAHMQFRPAGPLMDIRLMSGELEEIHLPHFLCLGSCEASVRDAVRVLHGRDSGVCMEVCELTRRHARLAHPSFSLLGLVYYLRDLFFPKVHCELLLFCTCPAPLTLHAYLVPKDPAHIRDIHQEEKLEGVRSRKPGAVGPLQLEASVHVRTSCRSEILPEMMSLWPLSTANFCEVYMEQPEEGFDLEVISSQHTEPIWRTKIRRNDYWQPSRSPGQVGIQEAAGFVDENRAELISRVREVMPIADELLSQGVIGQETYSNIDAAPTSQGKMRVLYDSLQTAKVKLAFYRILQAQQRLLVEDLWTA
ncbi:protein NLRC3-like [Clupea harengus]|uniref:Protein NLRC3-like n=1 Tax=Clupea harengus TaxID=7950 RepID=A0A8M1KQP3_CLUHA|nr:protein NLRC3-like [Clupea harengus]